MRPVVGEDGGHDIGHADLDMDVACGLGLEDAQEYLFQRVLVFRKPYGRDEPVFRDLVEEVEQFTDGGLLRRNHDGVRRIGQIIRRRQDEIKAEDAVEEDVDRDADQHAEGDIGDHDLPEGAAFDEEFAQPTADRMEDQDDSDIA